MADIVEENIWLIEEKMETFALVTGCEAKELPPWGGTRWNWNNYLSGFGFKSVGELPWRENSRNLGRRWIYKGKVEILMEVFSRKGQGVAMAIPLVTWTLGQPNPPELHDLALQFRTFCAMEALKGCPEGGIIWKYNEGAIGLLYRPPTETADSMDLLQPDEGDGEEILDELLLVAYASAYVLPCEDVDPISESFHSGIRKNVHPMSTGRK